jgi:hypothetical protein
MSENSGIGAQSYRGPGEWPEDWINEKWNEGHAIPSVTGHGNKNWLVVMSRVVGHKGLQGYSGKLDSPGEWIETKGNTPQVPAKSNQGPEFDQFNFRSKCIRAAPLQRHP